MMHLSKWADATASSWGESFRWTNLARLMSAFVHLANIDSFWQAPPTNRPSTLLTSSPTALPASSPTPANSPTSSPTALPTESPMSSPTVSQPETPPVMPSSVPTQSPLPAPSAAVSLLSGQICESSDECENGACGHEFFDLESDKICCPSNAVERIPNCQHDGKIY